MVPPRYITNWNYGTIDNANHGNARHGRHLIFCAVGFDGVIISDGRYRITMLCNLYSLVISFLVISIIPDNTITVFDLISEHALISEPPLFFLNKKKKNLLFFFFFFRDPVIIISGPSHATIFGSSVLRFAPGIDADKKKKGGGGPLIRAIFWAQNYVSGQSAN